MDADSLKSSDAITDSDFSILKSFLVREGYAAIDENVVKFRLPSSKRPLPITSADRGTVSISFTIQTLHTQISLLEERVWHQLLSRSHQHRFQSPIQTVKKHWPRPQRLEPDTTWSRASAWKRSCKTAPRPWKLLMASTPRSSNRILTQRYPLTISRRLDPRGLPRWGRYPKHCDREPRADGARCRRGHANGGRRACIARGD